jgi:hypothetical protein
MGLSNALLPEFDNEMKNTRKTLERVPDDRFDWKPHEKSTAMGGLAGHLANLPSWGSLAVDSDSFDLAPGGQPVKTPPLSAGKDVLSKFDQNVAATRAAIAGASDEELFQTLDVTIKRKHPDDDAEDRSTAQLRAEPHDSSSRSARCVPAIKRHSGAVDLWPIGRRESVWLEQLKLDSEILLRVLPEVVNQFHSFR